MNIEDENNVSFLLNTIWFKSQIVPTVYVQMDLSNPICNWMIQLLICTGVNYNTINM
jgi:hypothetical protein